MSEKLPIYPLEEIRARFEAGIQSFLEAESKLFAARIGERPMCSHLAAHLHESFAPWEADAEYDSFGTIRKRSAIPSRKKIKHPLGHLVTPDIIIHEPLNPTGNLLAIEAKGEDDQRGTEEDREKLRSYQNGPLFYPYVAMLIIGATDVPTCKYELFDSTENPLTAKAAVTLTAPRYPR